jgi:hypothetical protein
MSFVCCSCQPRRQSYAVPNRNYAGGLSPYRTKPVPRFSIPRTPYNTNTTHTPTNIHTHFPPFLRALPLRKNTPPRAPIRKHQPSPCPLLANLNHSLPRASIRLVRTRNMFVFPRESNNLATRCLNCQFRRLGCRTTARRARRRLRRVRVV